MLLTVRNWEKLPVVLTPRNLQDVLQCSESTVYKLLESQKIKNGRSGKKYFILKDNVKAFLNGENNEKGSAENGNVSYRNV